MGSGYSLELVNGCNRIYFVLSHLGGSQPQKFLEKIMAKDGGSYESMHAQLRMFDERGHTRMPGNYKVIDGGEICLLELKSPARCKKCIRILALYTNNGYALLYAFLGHNGSNKIPPELLKRARNVMTEVGELLNDEREPNE